MKSLSKANCTTHREFICRKMMPLPAVTESISAETYLASQATLVSTGSLLWLWIVIFVLVILMVIVCICLRKKVADQNVVVAKKVPMQTPNMSQDDMTVTELGDTNKNMQFNNTGG